MRKCTCTCALKHYRQTQTKRPCLPTAMPSDSSWLRAPPRACLPAGVLSYVLAGLDAKAHTVNACLMRLDQPRNELCRKVAERLTLPCVPDTRSRLLPAFPQCRWAGLARTQAFEHEVTLLGALVRGARCVRAVLGLVPATCRKLTSGMVPGSGAGSGVLVKAPRLTRHWPPPHP